MTDALPVPMDVLPSGLTNAFRCLRDVPILLFVEVSKVNRRGRRQRRFIVVTSTHLYSCVENGTIQRCVAARAIESVHVWLGASPLVGLKIPAEYDMLLGPASASDASGLSAALFRACGLDAIVRADAPGAAEFRLERPRGFVRAVPSSVQWAIGAAGVCPAGAAELFVAESFAAESFAAESFVAKSFVAGVRPAPLSDEALEAPRELPAAGADYSDEETAGSGSGVRDVGAAAGDEGGRAAPAPAHAAEEALREERRRRAEEHRQWCVLIAAERRNAQQLRETIAELRAQVFALTEKNIALRSRLMTEPWIDNQVKEGPR